MIDQRTDGGRFGDLAQEAVVQRAVAGADRAERAIVAALVVGGVAAMAASPAIRRLTWRVVRGAIGTWLPLVVGRQLKEAWRAAAAPPAAERRTPAHGEPRGAQSPVEG
jgi:hypothetical protein